MSEHTKEPWRIGNLQSYDAYTGKPFRNIWAGEDDEAIVVARCIDNGNCDDDARRIVACVNSLRGMPTEDLESGIVAEMRDVLIALASNPRIDLGDMVYAVRDRELKGWDGPDVKQWGDATTRFAALVAKLKGA